MSCSHLATASLSPPAYGTVVHREECTQCFDSQDDEDGIDVCLKCFNAGCPRQHAPLHAQRQGAAHSLVVNIKRRRKAGSQRASDDEPPLKKLAIRQEASEAELYDWHNSVKCYACDPASGKSLDVSSDAQTSTIVQGIMSSMSSAQQSEIKAWEEEILPCQHTHELVQNASMTLSPAGLATCALCDLKENLWLCLTCGALGCGRKQFGGTQSGNGHGLGHFESTGHPVAVKLGTIEPEGKADVYCYSCNDAKLDDHLAAHLSNFGIDVAGQRKTEKSMTELQLEQNMNFDFAMTGEDGHALKPLFGPGLTGLKNLGNSCYMASTLQTLFSLDAFKQRYAESSVRSHAYTCDKTDPSQCLECQMIKIGDGLLSGRYSVPSKGEMNYALTVPSSTQPVFTEGKDLAKSDPSRFQEGIKPAMFKALIGKDHPEFKTMRQQDADEFARHLLKTLEQNERKFNSSSVKQVTDVFKFEMENRLQCTECKGVRYKTEQQDALSVPVPIVEIEPEDLPMDVDGKQKEAPKKQYKPVALSECLRLLCSPQEVEYRCPSCKKTVIASKDNRFASFPDVLMVHARRFKLDGWVPQKVDVPITIREDNSLSLDDLRSDGKQEGEVDLPQDEAVAAEQPQFDPTALSQLEAMGFPAIQCQKALLATGNADAEAAMNWLFQHLEDPDINDPISISRAEPAGSEVSSASVATIQEMGFSEPQAKKALRETGNSVERAIEWLFSHPDDMGDIEVLDNAAESTQKKKYGSTDTPAEYTLHAFISHKGPSVHSGHYVAHVNSNQGWVLFNDEKVVRADSGEQAASKLSPLAYVYVFVRKR